jgi:ketosteroid isomerase-like protein
MKPQAGGPEAAINGKYLTVFKKQSDGSWKIYRDCFNSNTP